MLPALLSRTAPLLRPRRQQLLALHVRALAVNALEESLERAATDPAHRPAFYRDLLESHIYVVSSPPPSTSDTPQQEEALYLQQWQVPTTSGDTTATKAILPFFSSLENLQQVAQEEQPRYAKLECRTYLELVKDYPTAIVLNPGLPYGKEFVPQEIAGLLDGSLLAEGEAEGEAASAPVDAHMLPEGTQILMGQPKVYPQQLVDALKELFEKTPTVQAAYLAQVFVKDSGEPPNVYIGIQLTSGGWASANEFQSVLQEAIQVQQTVCPEDVIDFVQVTDNTEETITKNMRTKTKPFFVRQ